MAEHRKRYTLTYLVNQCDQNAPYPKALEQWDQAPLIGNEVLPFSEHQLLQNFDTHTAHAGELATPSANETDPLLRLKGSVEHYDRPFDPADDWGDGENR